MPKTSISGNREMYSFTGLTITNNVNDSLYMIIDSEAQTNQ